MSKGGIVILIFLLVIASLAVVPFILERMGFEAKPKGMVGSEAPDFELKSTRGETVKLSELKGSVVLLDFWATWCGPCRKAIPFLSRLYSEYSDRGLVILSINLGESSDVVLEFANRHKMAWTVLLDPEGAVADFYNVRAIPTFVVIDKDGMVRYRESGYSQSVEREITSIIEEILGG